MCDVSLVFCVLQTVRFLAYVDLLGTTYSASTLATGYGAYIAQPLLRSAVENNEDTLTEEAARKIIEDSMRVLYYRDARSINKVRLLPPIPLQMD
jgi:20S proteasome subunit beta 7